MENQIERAMKVGRGYWFVDGVTEMLVGGLFVGLGGVVLVGGTRSQESLVARLAGMAGEIALIKVLGIVAAGLILWWVKDRFTYPRSGFVRGRRMTTAQMLTLLRNAVLCLLVPVLGLAAALVWLPWRGGILFSIPVWLPVGMAAIWGVACMLLGEWSGLRRFVWMGGVILLAGIVISAWQWAVGVGTAAVEGLQPGNLAGLSETQPGLLADLLNRSLASIGWLTVVAGGVFVLSGVVIFLRFRKENPAVQKEEA